MSQPPPLPPDRLRRRAASVERRPLRRRKPWLVPVLVLTVLGLLAGAILVGSELQRGRERRSALRMAHRGMHERAEARLRYWVHADPSDMEARLALADCLLGLERWGEAAEEYEFVAAARADDARAWRGLGGARLELGEEEAAAAALARAQALAPGDAVTSFRLARVHYALGAHFEAEAAARAALAEAPGLGAAKALLGRVLHASGRTDEALALLDGALLEHPSEAAVYAALGAAHSGRGAYAVAADQYRMAVRTGDASVETGLGLAEVLSHLDRAQEARAVLEILVRQHERAAEPWYVLGMLQQDAGDTAGALGSYGQCLSLDPGHERAREALTTLRRVTGR